MNHKMYVRAVITFLVALMLSIQSTGVSANPSENLTRHGNVFTVSPTGVDDTANILQAFADAKQAGPGSTVQFTSGMFITDLIQVENFNGYVKGKGEKKTFIQPRPNQDCKAWIDQGMLPSLFRFTEGSIHVSGLSLKFDDPNPCVPYTFAWWGGEYTTYIYFGIHFAGPVPRNMTDCAFLKVGKVKGIVDRVSVLLADGVNMIAGINAGGDFIFSGSCIDFGYNPEITLEITNSYVENAWWLLSAQNIDGGSILIKDNTLHEGGNSIFVADVAGAPVMILDNVLENPAWNGIYLAQGLFPNIWMPLRPALFVARNNTITIKDDHTWGFLVSDTTFYLGENETPRMQLILDRNQIIQNGPTTTGVYGFGVSNALVTNNRFSGQGESAISNGNPSYYGDFPSEKWLIKGNDLSSFQPTSNKIILGALSRTCLVVTANTDDVLDQGTDNVIIGGIVLRGKGPNPIGLDKMDRLPRH